MIFLDTRDGALGEAINGIILDGHIRIKFFNHPADLDALFVPVESIKPFWLQLGDILILDNGNTIRIDKIFYDFKYGIYSVEYSFVPTKLGEPSYKIDVELIGSSIYGFA